MGFVFDKWENAEKFTAYADKTLVDIVQEKCEPGVTWQDLAFFNYGTKENDEVKRCLIEQAGVKELKDKAEETVLDPAQAPTAQDGVKEIRIPKIWKKTGLELEKTHTITVKQRKPAPSVGFEKFSRWFIPDAEKCDLSYYLQGIKERAEKVHLDVWASNYCKATESPIGPEQEFYQYKLDPSDVPIYQNAEMDAGERSAHEYNEWDGVTTATEGVLKKRYFPKRTLTVANSPYTAQLRYFKNDSDKTARIDLKPFWPLWKKVGNTANFELDDATLKIEWEVKNCSKLKHGQLIIWDKTDKPVYRKALGTSDLSQGAHDFTWTDGKSKNIAEKAKQPYRVQIQAHSDWATDDGLALAAMHTEVRLWVDPAVGVNADRLQDKQCFKFKVPDYLPDEDLAKREGSAAEVTRWYKLKLAEGGFHPGVIDNRANNEDYVLALKEFQRATPKDYGPNETPRYTRVKADGQQNEDTRNMLDNLKKDRRPLFAETNYTDLIGDAVETKLSDKDAKIIAWVEDRHYHTGGAQATAPNANMKLEDYGGTFACNDAQKADVEKKSVARPFLPIEVALPLMSKADHLDFEGNVPAAPPDVTDSMRRATGQIRVDWSFRDMEPDDTGFSATYNNDGKNWNRSKKYVEKTIKVTPEVKHEDIVCYNCKETYGGIRPDAIAEYYKHPFSLDADSLLPWRAVADTAQKKVCTLTHDDLGVADAHFHKKVQGKTGIYLHPSRIAGDGYRFRAQVSFKPHPTADWKHPNYEVLEKRYSALPQAHTCEIRLWRKASYRMYSKWAKASIALDYAGATAGAADYYKPAFTHFVHESGQPESIAFNKLLDPTSDDDKKLYKDLIDGHITNRADYPGKDKMELSVNQFWPWEHLDNYGLPWQKANKKKGEFYNWLQSSVKPDTVDVFYEYLLMQLLDQAEQRMGLMAGHFLVLYQAVPELWVRSYICDGAGKHEVAAPERRQAEAKGLNQTCPVSGCGGTLKQAYTKQYECDQCGDEIPLLEGSNTADAKLTQEHSTCSSTPKGHLILNTGAPDPPHNDEVVEESWLSGLGEAAAGLALGALWVYNERDGLGAALRTIAHEYGHHKHLIHTAGGYINAEATAQHDSTSNTVGPQNPGGHHAASAWDNNWDRRCMMSYFRNPDNNNNVGGYDQNRYFCGKCILKLRGWKVESLPAVASGEHG